MLLNAYNLTTGKLVRAGEKVSIWETNDATFELAERGNDKGHDGKVVVRYLDKAGDPTDDRGYFYARVAGLKVLSPETLHMGTFRETCGSRGCPGCIR
jgi:N-acetyl-beta-hexosaminidase